MKYTLTIIGICIPILAFSVWRWLWHGDSSWAFSAGLFTNTMMIALRHLPGDYREWRDDRLREHYRREFGITDDKRVPHFRR